MGKNSNNYYVLVITMPSTFFHLIFKIYLRERGWGEGKAHTESSCVLLRSPDACKPNSGLDKGSRKLLLEPSLHLPWFAVGSCSQEPELRISPGTLMRDADVLTAEVNTHCLLTSFL